MQRQRESVPSTIEFAGMHAGSEPSTPVETLLYPGCYNPRNRYLEQITASWHRFHCPRNYTPYPDRSGHANAGFVACHCWHLPRLPDEPVDRGIQSNPPPENGIPASTLL